MYEVVLFAMTAVALFLCVMGVMAVIDVVRGTERRK